MAALFVLSFRFLSRTNYMSNIYSMNKKGPVAESGWKEVTPILWNCCYCNETGFINDV